MPPFLVEVREAVRKLMGEKVAEVCNISAEVLKTGGEAMVQGLHMGVSAAW